LDFTALWIQIIKGFQNHSGKIFRPRVKLRLNTTFISVVATKISFEIVIKTYISMKKDKIFLFGLLQ